MPSSQLRRSAVARVDATLSERARSQGLDVLPGRVRRWRMAGLLPSPSSRIEDPCVGLGRPPRTYSEDEWSQAESNVRFLAAHARRGRGASELAVLLFANGFEVRPEVVIDALNAMTATVQRIVGEIEVKARAFAEVVPEEMRLNAAFETSSAMSRMMLAQRTELTRLIRRNLRKAGVPHTDADVETVLVACIGATQGLPPNPQDEEALNGLMHGFAAHGLLESISHEVGPVVDDGLAGVADALKRASRAAQTPLPSDVTMGELNEARDMLRNLAAMYRVVPEPLLHFLGGSAVADLWDPLDPVRVTQTVTWAVNARRDDGIDPRPIFEAGRDAGWLPATFGDVHGSGRPS